MELNIISISLMMLLVNLYTQSLSLCSAWMKSLQSFHFKSFYGIKWPVSQCCCTVLRGDAPLCTKGCPSHCHSLGQSVMSKFFLVIFLPLTKPFSSMLKMLWTSLVFVHPLLLEFYFKSHNLIYKICCVIFSNFTFIHLSVYFL